MVTLIYNKQLLTTETSKTDLSLYYILFLNIPSLTKLITFHAT